MGGLSLVPQSEASKQEMLDALKELAAQVEAGELLGFALIEKRRSTGLTWSRVQLPDLDVVWGAQALIFRLMLERREQLEQGA